MCRGHGYIVCVTCLRLCLDSTEATTTTKARSSSNYKHYYFILGRVWHFLQFYLSERIMRIMMRDAYTKGLQFCPLSPTPPSLPLSPRFSTHVSSIRSVSSSQHFYLIPSIICAWCADRPGKNVCFALLGEFVHRMSTPVIFIPELSWTDTYTNK